MRKTAKSTSTSPFTDSRAIYVFILNSERREEQTYTFFSYLHIIVSLPIFTLFHVEIIIHSYRYIMILYFFSFWKHIVSYLWYLPQYCRSHFKWVMFCNFLLYGYMYITIFF